MKKWLTFVLLVAICAATFYPCCGKDNCCNDDMPAKTTNQSQEKPEGTCSPFITCCSCTGFVQMTDVVIIPGIQVEKPIHNAGVISITLSSYTSSLLQPPRVG